MIEANYLYGAQNILQVLVNSLSNDYEMDSIVDLTTSLIKREQISSTEINPGVIMPHAVTELVEDFKMYFIKLDQELVSDARNVNVVIILLVNEQNKHNKQLENLIKLIADEQFCNEIKQLKEGQKIKDYIGVRIC